MSEIMASFMLKKATKDMLGDSDDPEAERKEKDAQKKEEEKLRAQQKKREEERKKRAEKRKEEGDKRRADMYAKYGIEPKDSGSSGKKEAKKEAPKPEGDNYQDVPDIDDSDKPGKCANGCVIC